MIECQIFLICYQEFDKVMYYPHHYSLYMWMTLLRKLLSVALTVICHLFYAHDLFLIAPSVHTLQILFIFCETDLSWFDMCINVNKSVCMHFGQHFNIQCANLITNSGDGLKWVEECRYLGVYLVSARRFKCSWNNAK